MVALRDVVSPNVLLVAFFTALLSSALDQYPSSLTIEPFEPQYALRTVAQQTRYEQNPNIAHSSVFATSSPLYAHAEVLFPNASLPAPQSLAVSADGRAFVGLADGRIVSFRDDNNNNNNELSPSEFSRTGRALPDCGLANATLETQMRCGRAIALAFAPSAFLRKFVDRIPDATLFASEQVLLVADAFRGVFLFDARGHKTLLFSAAGKHNTLRFLTGLAVSRRGEIYVTDASRTFTRRDLVATLLERSATGQLVHYSPETATATVLAAGLAFPTGVALVDNDSAVLVALATQHKVAKFTLTTRTLEDFAFTPGEPSGLSIVSTPSGRDVLCVGLFAPATAIENAIGRSPKVRKLLALLPATATLQLLQLRTAFATLDIATGDVRQVYAQTFGRSPYISSVFAFRGFLYLGSWHRDGLVRVPAAALQE